MENLKFLWKISQNIWKLKNKAIKSNELVKWEWRSAMTKNSKRTLPLFYTKSVLKTSIYQENVQRHFSDNSKPEPLKLMDFNTLVWPSLFKTIKNWIYVNFIIRPYLDHDFTLSDFVEGAKLATEIVSQNLASGKLSELDGLVTADCLAEVKKNLSVLNATQRHEISINKEDIYFSFPYELGILFDDKASSETTQERFVEITVVHHVLRGHKEMRERNEVIPLNVGMLPEFRDKIFILNYRFIRNYTKGVSDQWTVNVINHFKPTEFT